MKSIKNKVARKLTFSMIFIFIFVLFSSGIIIVDQNTRAVGFNDETPTIEIINNDENLQKHKLQLRLFGSIYEVNYFLFYSLLERTFESVKWLWNFLKSYLFWYF
ncbi:MAG: hypothetical protein LBT82_01580 [Oscillospiraceae bacterium]|jgi:hypothetical protein|nr:hypothetical protein [Oscillospiraceae bacterium]